IPARVSRTRPPLGLATRAPWHSQQRSASTGRMAFSKNSIPSGSAPPAAWARAVPIAPPAPRSQSPSKTARTGRDRPDDRPPAGPGPAGPHRPAGTMPRISEPSSNGLIADPSPECSRLELPPEVDYPEQTRGFRPRSGRGSVSDLARRLDGVEALDQPV